MPGSLSVPLVDVSGAAMSDPAVRPSLLPDGAPPSRHPVVAADGRVKVLIADDNQLSAESLKKTISRWGYDAETVTDGGAAFTTLLKPDAPLLALLDWEMPGLSGIDVCRLLRARGGGPYVYVLLCTSKERQRNLINGLAAGADDYIKKPFDLQELEVRLRAGRRIVLLQNQLLDAQAELEHRALHDSLTGLKNRGAILDVLERCLFRARRLEKSLSVVLGDLDFFKRVNDNHGHTAGDAVLKAFAERAVGAVGAHDEVGRYGGEEFLVVLYERGSDGAFAASERIREAMRSPVDVPSARIHVTVSLGVAGTDQGHWTADALINAADAALYAAKESGRNRTVTSQKTGCDAVTARPTAKAP